MTLESGKPVQGYALVSPGCFLDLNWRVCTGQGSPAQWVGEGGTRPNWGDPWEVWPRPADIGANWSSLIGVAAVQHQVRGINSSYLGLCCSQHAPCWIWGRPTDLPVPSWVGLRLHDCSPTHIYQEVSPIDLSGVYVLVDMHKFAL